MKQFKKVIVNVFVCALLSVAVLVGASCSFNINGTVSMDSGLGDSISGIINGGNSQSDDSGASDFDSTLNNSGNEQPTPDDGGESGSTPTPDDGGDEQPMPDNSGSGDSTPMPDDGGDGGCEHDYDEYGICLGCQSVAEWHTEHRLESEYMEGNCEDYWTTGYCPCGYTERICFPGIGHNYCVEYINEPTCTGKGYTTYTCDRCWDSYQDDYVDALGHSYDSVTVEPTCTEKGYTTYTCGACGKSYQEVIDANGHNWVNGECDGCKSSYYTEGIAYELGNDGMHYIVAGIGFCADTDIIIPSIFKGVSVTAIKDNAFENCGNLISVIIPDSVTEIGDKAFCLCSGLKNVEMGNGVTHIYAFAFYGCSNLTSLNMGNNVKWIGESAFSRCDGLKSILIPNSVTSIGYRAFQYCSRLENIVVPNSVTSIGCESFNGCNNLISITLPFVGASANTRLGEEKVFGYIFGYIMSKNSINEATFQYYNANNGFSYYYYIPATLTSVTITSTTVIPKYAFSHCDNLTDIEIPNNVTSIGDSAFEECTSLTNIKIPDGVSSIGCSAFSGSGLTSVVIPQSITSIREYLFNYCADLTSITFNGTVTQWSALEKGSNWNYNVAATVVVCKDGTVAL